MISEHAVQHRQGCWAILGAICINFASWLKMVLRDEIFEDNSLAI